MITSLGTQEDISITPYSGAQPFCQYSVSRQELILNSTLRACSNPTQESATMSEPTETTPIDKPEEA